MLTSTAIAAAFALSEKLADRSYAIQAISDTPLSKLTALSIEADAYVNALPAKERQEAMDAMAPLSVRLQNNTLADSDGGAHDAAMDEAVALVSRAVLYTLDLARNTVNPLIARVVDEVSAQITERTTAASSPVWIETEQLNPLFLSPMLMELVGRYGQSLVTQRQLMNLGLPVPDAGSIAELTSVGAALLDADIASFVQSIGAEWIETTWNCLFNSDQPLTAFFGGRNYDSTLLAFLLVRHAAEHIPEGITTIDLATWREYTSDLTASLGRLVCDQIDAWNFDVKARKLIVSRPSVSSPEGPVTVLAPVYNEFINAGGTPETIFGALYSDGETGFQALLDGKVQYEKAWQSSRGLIQQRASAEMFTCMVEALSFSLARIVNEIPDDQLQLPRAEMHNVIAERLSHAKPSDLDNLYLLVRKAICRVLYPHTDAEQLLIYVDEAAANNPEITDVRELALLGTVSYVASWLSKLMSVADLSAGA